MDHSPVASFPGQPNSKWKRQQEKQEWRKIVREALIRGDWLKIKLMCSYWQDHIQK